MIIVSNTLSFGGQTGYIKGMEFGGIISYTEDKKFAFMFNDFEAAKTWGDKHLYKFDELFTIKNYEQA